MQDFRVRLRSFQDVQAFVRLSAAQPFRIFLENDHQRVDATSYMGLVSLDHRDSLRVSSDCSEGQYKAFSLQAASFAAE